VDDWTLNQLFCGLGMSLAVMTGLAILNTRHDRKGCAHKFEFESLAVQHGFRDVGGGRPLDGDGGQAWVREGRGTGSLLPSWYLGILAK